MSLNMILPGDRIDQTDDVDTFNIKKIKNKEVSKYIIYIIFNYSYLIIGLGLGFF